MYHVTPAGEFEPVDRSPNGLQAGLNMWDNIMREYAEEYLGHEEYVEAGGWSIDYDNASPFRELNQGVRDGTVRPWYLGVVIDPLTWKPEIMTAAVFDAAVFHDVFPDLSRDPEGKKLGEHFDGRRTGYVFDQEQVDTFLRSGRTTPVSHALLSTAWAARGVLLYT